ncbi:MAG: pyridoxal phosphate-dependent aminotransferase [Chloroflexi bacterium]|nr:pyridoxal phosphate-dependent aminotransferase [Chloroflexota bacterium]
MISRRAQQISPFLAMDVLERARQLEESGTHIVHLEVGEPDFDVPDCVKEAITRAVMAGNTHYTHSLGELRLREAICRYYKDSYQVSISPEQVVVSSGTSPIMMLLFATLLEDGDEVILSDPRYACYPNMVRFAGGEPVDVPVYEEDGFQMHPQAVSERITARTQAIVINSPSNPTGTLLTPENMRGIADLGITVVSDEIYHGLVYGGRAHSILEYTDDAVVIDGFSKRYAMTGLRLGYLIAPRRYVRALQKLQQNFVISASSVAQAGALAALEQAGPDVQRMARQYDARRRLMLDGLGRLGLSPASEPTGAFYVFVNARHICADSYRLAYDILEQARVGVTPGADFGSRGEGYLRLSYASSTSNIEEALARLEAYLAGLPDGRLAA